MTVLISVAAVLMIVVSVGLYWSKHWQFERAFFVGLLGAVVLGLYAIEQHGEDLARQNTKDTAALLASNAKDSSERLAQAMILGCQREYRNIGKPVNTTHREIRALARAASTDAKNRLDEPGASEAQKATAQRALKIWTAFEKAAAPVPKVNCEASVRADIASGKLKLPKKGET